jgi:hypothetical protein
MGLLPLLSSFGFSENPYNRGTVQLFGGTYDASAFRGLETDAQDVEVGVIEVTGTLVVVFQRHVHTIHPVVPERIAGICITQQANVNTK